MGATSRAPPSRSARTARTAATFPACPCPRAFTITIGIARPSPAPSVVFAVPSRTARDRAERSPAPREDAIVVSAMKGIEETTLRRMSEVLEEESPATRDGAARRPPGPSHAEEVARGLPTAVVAASRASRPSRRARSPRSSSRPTPSASTRTTTLVRCRSRSRSRTSSPSRRESATGSASATTPAARS